MKFLVDACVGRTLAEWLRTEGHDVVESRDRGPDPGDAMLLDWALKESRVVGTTDKDFGRLLYRDQQRHAGLVRLPDVTPARCVNLIEQVLVRHADRLKEGAIITVRGDRIRISRLRNLG